MKEWKNKFFAFKITFSYSQKKKKIQNFRWMNENEIDFLFLFSILT